MAYTAPRTWATSDQVTAADLNSEIRDNISFLANPPYVSVIRNANLSLPHITNTTVPFNGTDLADTDNMHNPAVNPERVTFTTAGIYLVEFHAHMESGNDYDHALVYFCKNASLSGEIGEGGALAQDATSAPPVNATLIHKFAAGDYLTVYMVQRNTAAVARNLVYVAGYSPVLTAVRLGIG